MYAWMLGQHHIFVSLFRFWFQDFPTDHLHDITSYWEQNIIFIMWKVTMIMVMMIDVDNFVEWINNNYAKVTSYKRRVLVELPSWLIKSEMCWWWRLWRCYSTSLSFDQKNVCCWHYKIGERGMHIAHFIVRKTYFNMNTHRRISIT